METYEKMKKKYGRFWALDPQKRDLVILHCLICGKELPDRLWMRSPSADRGQYFDCLSDKWYGMLINSEDCHSCRNGISAHEKESGKGYLQYDEYSLHKVYCNKCNCLIGHLHAPNSLGAAMDNGRWMLKINHCPHCAFRARHWYLGPLAYAISKLR